MIAGGSVAPGGHPMLVLVVDDSQILRRLVTAAVEKGGHRVATAADGNEALNVLKNLPVDAIVTDLLMPGMDGLAFTRMVRLDPRTAHVPILVYSTAAERELVEQAIEAGVQDYLVKPANAQVLAQKLDRLEKQALLSSDFHPVAVATQLGYGPDAKAGCRALAELAREAREALVALGEALAAGAIPEDRVLATQIHGAAGVLAVDSLSRPAAEMTRRLAEGQLAAAIGRYGEVASVVSRLERFLRSCAPSEQ